MRRPFFALLLAAALLAGCGDDSAASSGDLEPYTAALAESLAIEDVSDQFTEHHADCLASRWAEVIGIDRLEDVGTPPEVAAATSDDLSVFDLDQQELEEASSALLDCVADAEELLRAEFVGDSQGAQAECVAALVDRDLLVRILSTGIAGRDPVTELGDIQDEFENCA